MAQPGGAVMYGSLGAALWGTRVGCVSLVGTDYPVTMLDALSEHGIDLTGLHRLGGPGVRTWLLYEGPVRRLIHRLGCPTHEQVSPEAEHIPQAWQSAPAFHLAPMPFAVQRRLLASLATDQTLRVGRSASAGDRGDARRLAAGPGRRRRVFPG